MNKFYEKLLQDLYFFEMQNFLQFGYEVFVLEPFEQNYVTKVFNELMSKSLAHAKALGGEIVKLGGKPVFKNSGGVFLSGRSVEEISDIKSMVQKNIEKVETLIISYKTTLLKVEKKELISVLRHLLEEEIYLKLLLKNLDFE